MEEVQINGQSYISSKRAAEISGYTQDYVGQLARDRKISATRIGRSWYIDESDLREHAGIEPPACEDESEKGAQEEGDVSEEKKGGTTIPLNALHAHNKQEEKPDLFSTWSSVTYIVDDAPTHLPLAQKYTPYNERVIPIQKKDEEPRKVEKTYIQPRIHRTSQHTLLSPSQSMEGVIPPTKMASPPTTEKSRINENKKSQENNYIFISYFIPIALILTLIVVASGAHLPAEWSFTQKSNVAFASGAVSEEVQGAMLGYFSAMFFQGIELISDFLYTFIGSFGILFEIGFDFLKGLFS